MARCRRPPLVAVTLATALALTGCTATPEQPAAPSSASPQASAPLDSTTRDSTTPDSTAKPRATATPQQPVSPTKVLLLMEENTEAKDALAGPATSYLQELARQATVAPRLEAGYPARCPSLPAYLLLTSGSTHGICDDRGPEDHAVSGPNLFSQVVAIGREWRVFAQSMEGTCQRDNSADGRYLVRHTAAPYYTSERDRCERWQVPLGELGQGNFHDALAQGLPAFSLVVPDRCHDMHDGKVCSGDRRQQADAWLSSWVPQILASPDYTSGDLLVVLTWDEGSTTSNSVATLLLHAGLAGTVVDRAATHCDTLRTMSEVLGVEPLGCGARASTLVDLGVGNG